MKIEPSKGMLYVEVEPEDAENKSAGGLILPGSTAQFKKAKVIAMGESDRIYAKQDDMILLANDYKSVEVLPGFRLISDTAVLCVAVPDKEETNQILGRLGLPVPRQKLVYREEDAAVFAERIGFPVVVKPLNANHGRGAPWQLIFRPSPVYFLPMSSLKKFYAITPNGCGPYFAAAPIHCDPMRIPRPMKRPFPGWTCW